MRRLLLRLEGSRPRPGWGITAEEAAVGGAHEAPRPGTDLFMAAVVLGLCLLLAAVVVPALMG